NVHLICYPSVVAQRITNFAKYRNVLSSPRRSGGGVLVTETRRSRLAKTVHYEIAHLIRIIDALDNPTMKVLLPAPVAGLFPTAARRVHDHIRNSEPALERSGFDRNVLDIFERDGRFMDDPDTAANAQAPMRENIPRRVISQVNRRIRNDVRQDHNPQGQ